MKRKAVALAILILFVTGVFYVAPAFSITVSAKPFNHKGFDDNGLGQFTTCGDPVPGGGSGGGD